MLHSYLKKIFGTGLLFHAPAIFAGKKSAFLLFALFAGAAARLGGREPAQTSVAHTPELKSHFPDYGLSRELPVRDTTADPTLVHTSSAHLNTDGTVSIFSSNAPAEYSQIVVLTHKGAPVLGLYTVLTSAEDEFTIATDACLDDDGDCIEGEDLELEWRLASSQECTEQQPALEGQLWPTRDGKARISFNLDTFNPKEYLVILQSSDPSLRGNIFQVHYGVLDGESNVSYIDAEIDTEETILARKATQEEIAKRSMVMSSEVLFEPESRERYAALAHAQGFPLLHGRLRAGDKVAVFHCLRYKNALGIRTVRSYNDGIVTFEEASFPKIPYGYDTLTFRLARPEERRSGFMRLPIKLVITWQGPGENSSPVLSGYGLDARMINEGDYIYLFGEDPKLAAGSYQVLSKSNDQHIQLSVPEGIAPSTENHIYTYWTPITSEFDPR